MKKLMLGLITVMISFAANAEKWDYSSGNDDFGRSFVAASIASDKDGFSVVISNIIGSGYEVSIGIPDEYTASDCSLTKCEITLSAKDKKSKTFSTEIDGFGNGWVVEEQQKAFLAYFEDNKVVKLKAPVSKTSKTVTFTQEKRLSSKYLEAKGKKRK